ncbi:hypothetical protein HMPREF1608_03850 [Escherichia coli 908525]|nr:hypothetical protein HMPREF1608_03850 [Escherichia coli 908525]
MSWLSFILYMNKIAVSFMSCPAISRNFCAKAQKIFASPP